jgi:hypothetical protein
MTIDERTHHVPPATIIRTVISLSGSHDSDIAVHHARTCNARISFTLGEVLMVFYSCAAVQGLLAAFAAAKQHSALIPDQSPAVAACGDDCPVNRITVAIDWTRAPSYAAVAQSGLNKLHSHTLHWIDLYTAGITWQIRDRAAAAPRPPPRRCPSSGPRRRTAP